MVQEKKNLKAWLNFEKEQNFFLFFAVILTHIPSQDLLYL